MYAEALQLQCKMITQSLWGPESSAAALHGTQSQQSSHRSETSARLLLLSEWALPRGLCTYSANLVTYTCTISLQWLSTWPSTIIQLITKSNWNYDHLMTICPGLPRWVGTRRINHSGFCWSRHDGVAVASVEPYASYLHFASEDNHTSTSSVKIFTGWMPFWQPTNSVKALKAS